MNLLICCKISYIVKYGFIKEIKLQVINTKISKIVINCRF